MDINILGYVVRELNSIPRSRWPEIAAASGVSESTLQKIAYGVHENPGVLTVQAISNALMSRPPVRVPDGIKNGPAAA